MNHIQRRTPLRQITPLKPGGPLRRTVAPPVARSHAPVTPIAHGRKITPIRKNTLDPGFPPEVRDEIFARDGGCVLRGWADAPIPCGGGLTAHHRDLVGMGGTSNPGVHVAANGVCLCWHQHDYAHLWRLWARGLGLICDHGDSFLAEPVLLDGRTPVWLGLHGSYLYDNPSPEGNDAA